LDPKKGNFTLKCGKRKGTGICFVKTGREREGTGKKIGEVSCYKVKFYKYPFSKKVKQFVFKAKKPSRRDFQVVRVD